MKLSREQAYDLILRAHAAKRISPCLRMGQALWNALPTEMARVYVGTNIDFFFDTDEQTVYDKFFDNMVEEEE